MKYKKILVIAFFLMAIIQLAIPASMIIQQESTLKNGTIYKFRTEPVDPYDAFRGRYVALNIETNEVPVPAGKHFEQYQKVYASLKKDKNGFAIIESVSTEVPEGKDYIKAKVAYNGFINNLLNRVPDKVKINLPLDRYYMEEKSAPEAEKAYMEHSTRKTRDAYITVRILKGNSVIEDLFIGGKPVLEYIKQENTKKQ
jgi:uncharacterized membrane-anchored protein